eukprot:610169-Rhodomonas_salina.1
MLYGVLTFAGCPCIHSLSSFLRLRLALFRGQRRVFGVGYLGFMVLGLRFGGEALGSRATLD